MTSEDASDRIASNQTQAPAQDAEHAQAPGQLPPASTPSAAASSTTRVQPAPSATNTGHISALPKSKSVPTNVMPSRTPSAPASPLSSRDSSPARPGQKPQGVPRRSRSRKNSHEVSPQRRPSAPATGTSVPSAAAIQRALSASNTPQLQPLALTDSSAKPQQPQRSQGTTSGENTPQWPLSPSVKSPPPTTTGPSRQSSLIPTKTMKPTTSTTPSIVVQRSTPTATPPIAAKLDGLLSDWDDQTQMLSKGSSRGASGAASTLETVHEASLPTTPGFEAFNSQSLAPAKNTAAPSDDSFVSKRAGSTGEVRGDRNVKSDWNAVGSGLSKDDDKGKRQEPQMQTVPRPKPLTATASSTALAPPKAKSDAQVASKNMTVETETVSSIPQAAIGAGPGDRAVQGRGDPSGSLRLKPSNETIRPRKDRKRAVRKPPSINSGTASTKADIFEAKVASAVDATNSSDSDETFVYESNPADATPRANRNHSRTPSTTSMASLIDSRGARSTFGNVLDNGRGVAGKRSMKFSSNPYHQTANEDGDDWQEGVPRNGGPRPGGGNGVHHHHIGRYSRPGANYGALQDDSPYANSSKARAKAANDSRQSPKPASLRMLNQSNSRLASTASKQHGEFATYDMDGEGADDERTPLVGSIRAQRTRPRKPNSASIRQIEYYQKRDRGRLRKFGGCILLSVLVILLAAGAVGFLFATTKPMYDVRIKEIQNVLASEQEIMLDLLVGAINPNLLGVSVTEMDVNVFAKSKHVGTDRYWREHPHNDDWRCCSPPSTSFAKSRDQTRRRDRHSTTSTSPSYIPLHPLGTVDRGTNPINDPSSDAQTMLLGRIFHFDSALSFDGSPLKRHPHYSVGELRLQKPGNKTEAGGTERWERVLLHPFELIVRGILKYQLPLSGRTLTAPIGASVVVMPETGVGEEES